jgi:hypothetical protein
LQTHVEIILKTAEITSKYLKILWIREATPSSEAGARIAQRLVATGIQNDHQSVIAIGD